MRRFRFAGLVSAFALAAPLIGLAAPVQRTSPVSGKIISTKTGETMVLVQTSSSRPAEARQDLKAGDVLRTNAKGTLAIVFADRTQIRLARNSVLRVNAVQRGSPSSVTLQNGRIWGRTPRGGSNLSVETPAATAGIRGTEWSISVEGETTSLQVFSGEVELANDLGRLLVIGGQAARAVRGQAPTRVAIVNPDGREQMLYFVSLEDGLDLFAGEQLPGMAAARKGDWQDAREKFAAVPQGTRAKAIADFAEYIASVQLGEDREIPAIQPDQPISYVARTYVLSFIGDLEEAEATADEGLSRYPEEPALYELKARIALLRGDEASARQAVNEALARNADDAAALALRSELNLYYAGNPYEAFADAQRAVELEPERIGSYQALSEVRLERGGTREARAAIDAALALNPQSAALHAQRAEILLAQKRMGEAKAAIDRAIQLDPSLSVVRTALSEFFLLSGKEEQALEEGLAASVDNPAYSRALLQLAEVNYRLKETATAIQQLDAADRLDPHSPLTPLARTAIALHRYEADQAILSANEALHRFRARGGVYSNLSENRQTGSLVSRAFRFLELEGLGRYYADRVFDTFTPSSYFDQALNQTPGPFVVRDEDGNFNPNSAEDFDQLSSLIQGVALDPLSVANSERLLQFDNSSFFEAQAGSNYLTENLRERIGAESKINAITLQPFPIAVGIEAFYNETTDDRLRPDLGVFQELGFVSRNDDSDETSIEAYAGFEPGPYDQFAVNVGYSKDRDTAITELTQEPGAEPFILPREVKELETLFGIGLWSHEFGFRNRTTLLGGIGKFKTRTANSFDLDEFDGFNGQIPVSLTDSDVDFKFASVNYARGVAKVDLRVGAEFTDYRAKIDKSLFDLVDLNEAPALVASAPTRTLKLAELRGYANVRYRPVEQLVIEGQLNLVDVDLDLRSAAIAENSRNSTNVDYRLGAAIETARGHWIRAATLRETRTLFPFTFRPVNLLGLKGNQFPTEDIYRTRSHIVRWDAQWNRNFFTAVEFQDQLHGGVDYTVPDSSVTITGGPVRLRQYRIEANWWMEGNLGLRGSYAYTDSSIRGDFSTGLGTVGSILSRSGCTTADIPEIPCRFFRGDQLPFVPRHTARASIAWTVPAPWRIRTLFGANYVGGQSDDLRNELRDFVVADARIEFEPFERRFHLSAAALNLFDKDYSSARGVPAPGRTLVFSARVRF